MDSRDYAAFFRLLDGADYLVAVLMHRFFRRVRASALEILNKVTKNDRIPLYELVEVPYSSLYSNLYSDPYEPLLRRTAP